MTAVKSNAVPCHSQAVQIQYDQRLPLWDLPISVFLDISIVLEIEQEQ